MRRITKVVVLGLDGLEPTIVQRLLEEGELPGMARLRDRGGLSTVATTYPAQTPVAWSTFATGVNPGGHGIFDFIRRDPENYLPQLAFSRYRQSSPFLPPKAVNLRGGQPIWQVLSDAGLPSVILRCPCTYPPEQFNGRMLAGMGVPDLRGGLGTSTFYTSGDDVPSGEGETVVGVEPGPEGKLAAELLGPLNPKTRSPFRLGFTIEPKPDARKVLIRVAGTRGWGPGAGDQGLGARDEGRGTREIGSSPLAPSPQPLTPVLEVRQGCWSDWLKVKFKLGRLQSVRGMLRFYLVRVEPELELYASPINFDPDAPMFPVSWPRQYAGELASRVGTFYTTGMVEDHDGLKNGRLSEEAFLDQCEEVRKQREAMMLWELNRFDAGLLFCLFDTPDRIGHMFWRFREPDHPANRQDHRPGFERVIEDHYRACDTTVGKLLEAADDRTLLVVLSDHGLNSFRRGVHLNTWLHALGLLSLVGGVQPGDGAKPEGLGVRDEGLGEEKPSSLAPGPSPRAPSSDFFRHVDWSRTKAYALGLGGIYLNVKGREGQGIVPPEQAETLGSDIAKELTGLEDPQLGAAAVSGVVSKERIYQGPYVDEAPDLIVNFARGYRASWSTALGGVPEGHFEDNTTRWAGDHIVDPVLVPGVLAMNRPFRGPCARLVDLAPTILQSLGVGAPPAMEGRTLLE